MREWITKLIVTILVTVTPPTVSVPRTRYHGYALNHHAIQMARRFTALLQTTGFGPQTQASGILLDAHHVLTCAHVLEDPTDSIQALLYPGYFMDYARPVYVDSYHDLAILELETPAFDGVYPVFQPTTWDGEPITIIGNAEGSTTWFVSYGIISGRNFRDLYTDGLILEGNSGGPWVNENGEVVAMSDWVLDRKSHDTGIGGGISAATIQTFLAKWRKSK